MNQQDLGPLEAWQIRKFPRELRQAVVAAAKERHLSPGEFVTGILPKCGQRRLHDITGSGERASAVNGLAKLAEAAQRVADLADRLPKGLRANLFRALREAARAAIPPRAPPQKALAAPDPRVTALERFPLGLNWDSQGPRKGRVLAGDSVSGMRHDQAIFDGSAGACG